MSTEPDILEALTEIAEAKMGGPIPKCMVDAKGQPWGIALSEIARRAKAEIEYLREELAGFEPATDLSGDGI